MKIATRLRLVVVAVLLVTVAFIIGLRDWTDEMNAELDDLRASRQQLMLAIAIEHNVTSEVALSRSGASTATLDSLAKQTQTLLAELRASMVDESDLRELWYAETLASLQSTLEWQRAGATADARAREQARDLVVAIVGTIVRVEDQDLKDSAASVTHKEWTGIVVAIGVVFALTAVILVTVVAPMRRYLRAAVAATQRIAGGDLASPVAIAGPSDLEELGSAIDSMRIDLHDRLGIEARLREIEEFDRALTASEERYRTLFDLSPLPKCVFDSETLEITMCNQAMQSLTGYRRVELEALRIADLCVSVENGITTIRCKDGRARELEMTTHMIVAGGRVCSMCVGVDVTETRRIEEQLRQVQKLEAIGRLAGGVAHDFNNILAVIQMNAELVVDGLEDSHPARDDVREIKIASERGARLTRQLLAFSRQQKITPKPIVLNTLVSETEKMLSRVVGEDIAITFAQASSAGVVEADAGQLEQVLMNLVVNARDAMPDGGQITIETGATDLDERQAAPLGLRAGCYAVLSVADTGCGMTAEVKTRIFEPFFTTKEVGKGTGLGLANVFGIVSQSGGAIAIESELGCGSIFRIYLPRVSERITQATMAATMPLEKIRAATILVVEDEDAVRSAIRRLVKSWGYECIEARNGDMALDILRASRTRIDLLISDVVMPGINGYALAEQMQRLQPGLKVLMVSGHTEHPSLERQVTSERHAFVAKPFSAQTLGGAIRAVLADAPMPVASSAA